MYITPDILLDQTTLSVLSIALTAATVVSALLLARRHRDNQPITAAQYQTSPTPKQPLIDPTLARSHIDLKPPTALTLYLRTTDFLNGFDLIAALNDAGLHHTNKQIYQRNEHADGTGQPWFIATTLEPPHIINTVHPNQIQTKMIVLHLEFANICQLEQAITTMNSAAEHIANELRCQIYFQKTDQLLQPDDITKLKAQIAQHEQA